MILFTVCIGMGHGLGQSNMPVSYGGAPGVLEARCVYVFNGYLNFNVLRE